MANLVFLNDNSKEKVLFVLSLVVIKPLLADQSGVNNCFFSFPTVSLRSHHVNVQTIFVRKSTRAKATQGPQRPVTYT